MWDRIIELVVDAGPATIIYAVVILAGAVFEWWVWGNQYRRMVGEMEYWRDKTLDFAGLGEKAVEVASDLASKED